MLATALFSFLLNATGKRQYCWGRATAVGWFLARIAVSLVVGVASTPAWPATRKHTDGHLLLRAHICKRSNGRFEVQLWLASKLAAGESTARSTTGGEQRDPKSSTRETCRRQRLLRYSTTPTPRQQCPSPRVSHTQIIEPGICATDFPHLPNPPPPPAPLRAPTVVRKFRSRLFRSDPFCTYWYAETAI